MDIPDDEQLIQTHNPIIQDGDIEMNENKWK